MYPSFELLPFGAEREMEEEAQLGFGRMGGRARAGGRAGAGGMGAMGGHGAMMKRAGMATRGAPAGSAGMRPQRGAQRPAWGVSAGRRPSWPGRPGSPAGMAPGGGWPGPQGGLRPPRWPYARPYWPRYPGYFPAAVLGGGDVAVFDDGAMPDGGPDMGGGHAPADGAGYDPSSGAPDAGGGFDGFDDGAQGELPPTLQAALERIPSHQRPSYTALGTLTQALANELSRGSGLYLIEFPADGRDRAYSGQSGDMRRRLQQHLLCARIMGMNIALHKVYVAPLPKYDETRRRNLERRIHTIMKARYPGVLTNTQRELELELFESVWPR
ncbi:hypothetical protein HSX11_13495 [Oxalobacteraceae bacterium]|nr:hypothetical protein [Oxalobacteraceae bacterium]